MGCVIRLGDAHSGPMGQAEFVHLTDAVSVIKPRIPSITVSRIRLLEATGAIVVEIDDDGRRLVDPDEVVRVLTAKDEERRCAEHRAPCQVIPLRPRS